MAAGPGEVSTLPKCDAILLDLEAGQLGSMAGFITGLVDAMGRCRSASPPALVALVGASESVASKSMDTASPMLLELCKEEMRDMQERLHDLGVVEVIVKPRDPLEAHLAVDVALRRLGLAQLEREGWQATLAQKQSLAFQMKTQERLERMRRDVSRDVWSLASKISDGALPPVDVSLPRLIEEGMEVAGLVLDRMVGKGGYGTVLTAINSDTSAKEAVKAFCKHKLISPKDIVMVGREVEALRRLSHPNVVSFRGVLHAPNHVFLRMEHAGVSNLKRVMMSYEDQRLAAPYARALCRQLAAGLAHCHKQGIAHCDIKPENLGISECGEHLKILDFGLCAPTHELVELACGTMPFMAPEVMSGSPYSACAADIWATGVSLLEMLAGSGAMSHALGWCTCGASPRRGAELRALLGDGPGPLLDLIAGEVSAPLRLLFEGFFRLSAEQRFTADDVVVSPWLAATCGIDERPPAVGRPQPKVDAPAAASTADAPDDAGTSPPVHVPHTPMVPRSHRAQRPGFRLLRLKRADKVSQDLGACE